MLIPFIVAMVFFEFLFGSPKAFALTMWGAVLVLLSLVLLWQLESFFS